MVKILSLDNFLQSFRTPINQRTNCDLGRIKAILDLLGNPQNKFLAVHVAGTNGKGSVCAMLNSFFCQAGYRTALFTSPHLERFTERIRINDQEIAEKTFLKILNEKVFPCLNNHALRDFGKPTEFEIITIAAFCYFAEKEVEIAIIETGLGGRIDATNVLENVLVSVITSISFDHVDRLGDTLEKITREKAGIIKKNIPVITSDNNLVDIMKEYTELLSITRKDSVRKEDEYFFPANLSQKKENGYPVKVYDPNSFFDQKMFNLPFLGNFQRENLGLVLKTMEIIYHCREKLNHLKPKLPENIEEYTRLCQISISKATWLGRFEVIKKNDLTFILDGAHNPAGVKSFSETIKEIRKKKYIITIFACNKDKDAEEMLEKLIEITNFFILTTSHVKIKAKDPEILSQYLKNKNKINKIITDYSQTVSFASKIISESNLDQNDVLIIICGSLYLVGSLRTMINSTSL